MSSNLERRKLAAVMFADIEGYTALFQKNEREAFTLVEQHRTDLQQVSAQDQIFFLCQKRFGENYALAAATLLGMTTGEFVAWEAARRKFWEMW